MSSLTEPSGISVTPIILLNCEPAIAPPTAPTSAPLRAPTDLELEFLLPIKAPAAPSTTAPIAAFSVLHVGASRLQPSGPVDALLLVDCRLAQPASTAADIAVTTSRLI